MAFYKYHIHLFQTYLFFLSPHHLQICNRIKLDSVENVRNLGAFAATCQSL
jgi:hypothetical protein